MPLPRSVDRVVLAVTIALAIAGSVTRAESVDDLATTLDRATARVQEFFARAASLICQEKVHVQPLSSGLTGDGFGRSIESELRLSWVADSEGDGATAAQALRQVIKVNGHRPRKNDRNNCTTPEHRDTERQPLSLLLPGERDAYRWTLAGRGKVDGREAILLDFRETAPVTVDVKVLETNKDCISYDIEGGLRGRLWLDAESYDVLRMDHHLLGQVEVPMPKEVRRRPGASAIWTVERFDTTYRFKRLTFDDPAETIVLPVSVSSLRITHGAGQPRTRITTEYKNYRRFLTGGRILPGPSNQ